MNKVSQRTIERLSLYRRKLLFDLSGHEFVYSRELADSSSYTDVQVRRDLMNLGYKGIPRIGYSSKKLVKSINKFLDPQSNENVIIVGMGNNGRSLLPYFKKGKTKLNLVACFEVNDNIINTTIEGVPCFHTDELNSRVQEYGATIGILCCSKGSLKTVSEQMIISGIKSIINFTCHPFNDPTSDTYFEHIDITASFEKAIFFSKNRTENKSKQK